MTALAETAGRCLRAPGISVVAPASTAQPERVERGLAALRALGYAPQPGQHALQNAARSTLPERRRSASPTCTRPLPTQSTSAIMCTARRLRIELSARRPRSRTHRRASQALLRLQRPDRHATCACSISSACPPFTAPCWPRISVVEDGVHLPSFQRRAGRRALQRGRRRRPARFEARHARKRHALWRLPEHSGFAAGHALGAADRRQAALS